VKIFILIAVAAIGLVSGALAQGTKPLYENNFEKAAVGAVPEEFLVLDGGFVVKEENGNKFLELPGAPLETFGVLFGPAEKENVTVTARILGTGKGRRFPTFGVGVGGQGGYKLQLAPAKKAIELYKGDTLKASVPYEWESGNWTHFKLQMRKVNDGEWKIEGKVWTDAAKEPLTWSIGAVDSQEPTSGRASIWGMPFSGTPIRFDDLLVARTE